MKTNKSIIIALEILCCILFLLHSNCEHNVVIAKEKNDTTSLENTLNEINTKDKIKIKTSTLPTSTIKVTTKSSAATTTQKVTKSTAAASSVDKNPKTSTLPTSTIKVTTKSSAATTTQKVTKSTAAASVTKSSASIQDSTVISTSKNISKSEIDQNSTINYPEFKNETQTELVTPKKQKNNKLTIMAIFHELKFKKEFNLKTSMTYNQHYKFLNESLKEFTPNITSIVFSAGSLIMRADIMFPDTEVKKIKEIKNAYTDYLKNLTTKSFHNFTVKINPKSVKKTEIIVVKSAFPVWGTVLIVILILPIIAFVIYILIMRSKNGNTGLIQIFHLRHTKSWTCNSGNVRTSGIKTETEGVVIHNDHNENTNGKRIQMTDMNYNPTV